MEEIGITLHTFLIQKSFEHSMADYCVYVKNNSNVLQSNSKEIIIVWVDDLLIITSDHSSMGSIKCKVSKNYIERFRTVILLLGN